MVSLPKTISSLGKRDYRNRLADEIDQILFFSLFLIGSASIIFLKILDFSQLQVTLIPVALLLLYGVFAWTTERYRLRGDRIGDNIYYLGFLYTLVSLAYALYAYSVDESGIEQIITNFGIAIATTIVGLAGRVLFSQMRVNPDEYEREARHSLAEAINSMRSQLGDISAEASIFKRKLSQIIEESTIEFSRVAESAQGVQVSLQENIKKLDETGNSITERMGKIDEVFARSSEHFSQFNRTQENALKCIEDFMAASRISSEELRRGAKNSRATYDAVKSMLIEVGEKIEGSRKSVESLSESLTNQTGEIISRIKGTGQQPEDLASIFETFRGSLESHRDIMRDVNEAIRGELETIRSDLETAARYRGEIRENLGGSRKHLTAFRQYLVSEAKRILSRLKMLLSRAKQLLRRFGV